MTARAILREFATDADHSTNGSRWSYSRELGRIKLIVFDSREGRVLKGERRKIVDDREWEWIERHATGDVDHLLLADTLPVLLTPGEHYLEAWNEAVCAGAWGKVMRRLGERTRRLLDLEHWAAFSDSFHRMADLLRSVGAGERGRPPASVVLLGGDVHHAYLAEVAFRRDADVKSAVYQAVCSPYRNALDSHERAVVRVGSSRREPSWAACSRVLPAFRDPRSAGASRRVPRSTTSSPRSRSRGETRGCGSSASCLATGSALASRPHSIRFSPEVGQPSFPSRRRLRCSRARH